MHIIHDIHKYVVVDYSLALLMIRNNEILNEIINLGVLKNINDTDIT